MPPAKPIAAGWHQLPRESLEGGRPMILAYRSGVAWQIYGEIVIFDAIGGGFWSLNGKDAIRTDIWGKREDALRWIYTAELVYSCS